MSKVKVNCENCGKEHAKIHQKNGKFKSMKRGE